MLDFIGQLLNNLWFGIFVFSVLCAISAYWLNNWQRWLRLWGAFLFMQGVVWLIKYIVARQRPIGEHMLTNPSFPSGVAADTGFVAAYLSQMYPKYWILWHALCFGIALLRVYISAHYLGDVVVGYLIGVLLVWLTQDARLSKFPGITQ